VPQVCVMAHRKKASAKELGLLEKVMAWGHGEYELTDEEITLLADPPLSEQGRDQAEALCEAYLGQCEVPKRIFVSDRRRALDTAAPFIREMEEAWGWEGSLYVIRHLGQPDSGEVIEGFPETHPAYDRPYKMVCFSHFGSSTAPSWMMWTLRANQAIAGILREDPAEADEIIPIICHRPSAAVYRFLKRYGYLTTSVSEKDGHPGGRMDALNSELMELNRYELDILRPHARW